MTEEPASIVRRHTLSVLVCDEPGILAQIVGLCTGRGWNIDSLAVARATSSKHADYAISRITLVVMAADDRIGHVITKIDQLVNVFTVADLTSERDKIEAEITLVKAFTSDPVVQVQLAQMALVQFRGMSIRTTAEFVVLRFVGQPGDAAAFVAAVQRFGVDVESVHSGSIAI